MFLAEVSVPSKWFWGCYFTIKMLHNIALKHWHQPVLPLLLFAVLVFSSQPWLHFVPPSFFLLYPHFTFNYPSLQHAPVLQLPENTKTLPTISDSAPSPPDNTNHLANSLDQRHHVLTTTFAHSRGSASDCCMRECSHLNWAIQSHVDPAGASSTLFSAYTTPTSFYSPSSSSSSLSPC